MPPFWSASARGSALPLVEPTYIVSRQALPMRQQWRCFRFDRQRLRDNANHIAVAVAFSLTLSTSATSILLCTVVAALRFQEVRRQVMTLQGALPVLLVGLAMMGLLWADTAWSDRRAGLPGVFSIDGTDCEKTKMLERSSEAARWIARLEGKAT